MQNLKINQAMMKVTRGLEEIRETLFDCSRECVKVDGGGEWHTAETLFNLAKSVDLLRQQVKTIVDGASAATMIAAKQSKGHPTTAETKGADPLCLQRKRKDDYPKYVVRSDCLVKTGLSRNKRTEYEHEVPQQEFDKIVARVATMAASNKEFTVEQVQAGLDCPSYQTYIVIALLLQMDLLTSPWRGTYRFQAAERFASDVAVVWGRIPQA